MSYIHFFIFSLLLLLLPLLNAYSNQGPECVIEHTDPWDTSFVGIARVVTQSYTDGVKLVIDVKSILSDPGKALPARPKRIVAYLSNPICLSSVRIGQQQTWTGRYKLGGDDLKLVVQILNQADDITTDACSHRQCHPGAICETWNDPARSQIAVCVCLSLRDLATTGKCQLTSGQVCASNGTIYRSTCHMLKKSCLEQTELSIVSWTAVNDKDCQHQAELAKLRQIRSQPKDFIKTILDIPNAPSENDLEIEKPQQDSVQLTKSELPDSINKQSINKQSDCTQTCSSTSVQPVCGSDHNTYLNPCLLKQKSCLSNQSNKLRIMHWGYCPVKPPDIEPIFCDHANYCQFGAMCSSNSQSFTPLTRDYSLLMSRQSEKQGFLCVCDNYRCSEKWYKEPVCGDDGITYPGDCFLNQAACIQQSAKLQLHSGPCNMPSQGVNPCLEQSCAWPGEECRVDIQGRKTCVCPERCPAIVVPVCGSDGITYDSVCHLLLTACLNKKHIWVVYAGQCSSSGNACESYGIYCRRYEVCSQTSSQANRDTSPIYAVPSPQCGCPSCPGSGLGGKVCGSDGQTYRSECHLRSAACLRRLDDLEVKQRGSCDVCRNTKCEFYSICQTDEAGRAFCACPTNCLMVSMPVCGSDGRTYDNECLLKVHACSIQRDIKVVDAKPCATCSRSCPLGMQCLGGQCVCRKSCPKPSAPSEVCGTDSRIYPSICELRRRACINKATVNVDSSGLACRRPTANLNDSIGADAQSDGVVENSCGCNPVGSRGPLCDSKGRCRCHWGVEGDKCDRCPSGYWGISNGQPCISCSCNPLGSVNVDTCDSHWGHCKCKPGIRGQQCDICPNGKPLTGEGCQDSTLKVAESPTKSEANMTALTSGIKFTLSATAVMPFTQPISGPITFNLNFTPSVDISDGSIALLSLPRADKANKYRFLKLGISSGFLEFSFTNNLGTGQMKSVTGKHKLGPNSLMISAEVTSNEELVLRVDGLKGFSGSNLRQISSEEYGDMISYRDAGLVLGCISKNKASCGFAGCLTDAAVISYPSQGRAIEYAFVANGKAIEQLTWKNLPEGGIHGCLSQTTVLTPPKDASSSKALDNCEELDLCQNGGRCTASSEGQFQSCICPPGWQGIHCQLEATIIPEFNGTAHIRLTGPTGADSLKKRKMNMEVTFLRKSDEGIIFAIPPSQTDSEFIVIRAEADNCLKVYVRVGRLDQFAHLYKWFREPLKRLVIAKVCSVTNEEWHVIAIDKTSLYLTVQLDGQPATRLRLLPQSIGKLSRELRKALTTFDLSHSPVYLGGIPSPESHFLDDIVYAKQSFVGAIQKVVVNGAELVLAEPSQNEEHASRHPQMEHWEGIVQWQGVPCGEEYSSCSKDVNSPKRICRPLGGKYECTCSTPLTHMSFVRHLTASLSGIDLLNNLTAQQDISAQAEELACKAIVAKAKANSKDLQHDVPTKDSEIVISFNQGQHKKMEPVDNSIDRPIENSIQYPFAVQFSGKTVANYYGFTDKRDVLDNLRIRLKTESTDCLVLMIPERSHKFEEFLALALSHGRPAVHLSLRGPATQTPVHTSNYSSPGGRRITDVRASQFVADNEWHTIQIIRDKGYISIIVDDQIVRGELIGTDGILNNEGEIWLGGSLENVSFLPWQYQRNFTGCISAFFSNEVSVDLLADANPFYGPVSSC